MIGIGIESTAHTFSISVMNEKGKILSEVRDTYKTESGGIIPNEAARHHENVKDRVIREAIEKSKQEKFDIITYARGPGLSPCLHVGLKAAKDLAKDLKCNILGVNHCVSHLTHGKFLTKAKDPVFVYCSGANTQLIALEGGRYRIMGECMDIGMGNALDKFGRAVGLGFPAGPKIEKLAEKGKYIELPYVVKGMDLSFSGIITRAIELSKKGIKKEDLCFSLQETFFAMLTEVTERAVAHTGKKEVLLIGGVAANKRLVNMLKIMCKERNANFYAVPLEHSGDNGNMIIYQGFLEYNAGRREKKNEIKPYERTDDIIIFW